MACGKNHRRDDHSSCTPVARRIKQPTRMTGPDRPKPSLRVIPTRSCSRWGLPCRFRRRKRGALLPHRFTLAAAKRNAPRRSLLCGTVPGVLSPPDVIRHRLSVEPGLSSPAAFRHWRGAAVRPTDLIAMGICAYCVKVSCATALRRAKASCLRDCLGRQRRGPRFEQRT